MIENAIYIYFSFNSFHTTRVKIMLKAFGFKIVYKRVGMGARLRHVFRVLGFYHHVSLQQTAKTGYNDCTRCSRWPQPGGRGIMTKKFFENFVCISDTALWALVRYYTLKLLRGVSISLLWSHNEHHGVSNHQPHDYWLNRLFMRRSKKTSNFASLAFVRGIQWPVTRKIVLFYGVIMYPSPQYLPSYHFKVRDIIMSCKKCQQKPSRLLHYTDVIMGAMAFQITSLASVY